MVIQRIDKPADGAPMTSAERTQIFIRFAAIESIGVLALVIFLLGFFTLNWFPGQPTPVLVAALLAFALYVIFAAWASGLLGMIMTDRKNAGQ